MTTNEMIDFNLNVLKLMHGKNELKMTPRAREKLLVVDWKNEQLQLEKVLEDAVLNIKNNIIDATDLKFLNPRFELELPDGLKLESLERVYILQTLQRHEHNRTKAADALGISIRTLRNKISQYKMEGFL
jgi:two-component system, NtrC family, response regulator AtoC